MTSTPHSPPGKVDPAARLKLRAVHLLDQRIVDRLRSGAIRLVSVQWLLEQQAGFRILRRQELEKLEIKGASPFLPARTATKDLQSGTRRVLVLSYGWLSPSGPDPRGHRIGKLLAFLRLAAATFDPQIAELGIFWDYASLPQSPRSEVEQRMFKAALSVMGDLYASALGTSVLQLQEVPPQPDDWPALEIYNARPYFERGWCVFEDAATRCASGALLMRMAYEDTETEKRMRSKMIEVSGVKPRDRGHEDVPISGPEGRYPDEVAKRIQAATFTGKGDSEVVVSLYKEYYGKLDNATSRAQSYATTREYIKDNLYPGPAYCLLEMMTCCGYCYWPCCPCVCCVLIGVKEYGFGDSNQYADTPAEVTWRGVDPDGARRAKGLRSNRVAPADCALPQAQEMNRD